MLNFLRGAALLLGCFVPLAAAGEWRSISDTPPSVSPRPKKPASDEKQEPPEECRGCERRFRTAFSTDLLKKSESEISLNAHFFIPGVDLNVGLSDNLELGTNALFLAVQMPNFYVKHHMFSTPNTDTSFAGFYLGAAPKDTFLLFTMQGITSQYYLSPRTALHYGLFHLGLQVNVSETTGSQILKASGSGSALMVQLGADHQLTSSLNIFADLYPAPLGYLELESDIGDVYLSMSGMKRPVLLNSGFQWWMTESFNLSFYLQGVVTSPRPPSLGLSCAWRIK